MSLLRFSQRVHPPVDPASAGASCNVRGTQ